jgi:hypothetical protein
VFVFFGKLWHYDFFCSYFLNLFPKFHIPSLSWPCFILRRPFWNLWRFSTNFVLKFLDHSFKVPWPNSFQILSEPMSLFEACGISVYSNHLFSAVLTALNVCFEADVCRYPSMLAALPSKLHGFECLVSWRLLALFLCHFICLYVCRRFYMNC